MKLHPELNFEKDIEINPDQLGKELINHAKLYFQYNQKYLELAKERDLLKEQIDIIYAKKDASIREMAISKITENSIKNKILSDEEYIMTIQSHINKKYEAEIFLSAVKSFEQRKYMLNNITQLCNAEHFAKPKNPYDLSEIKNSEKSNLNKKKRSRG